MALGCQAPGGAAPAGELAPVAAPVALVPGDHGLQQLPLMLLAAGQVLLPLAVEHDVSAAQVAPRQPPRAPLARHRTTSPFRACTGHSRDTGCGWPVHLKYSARLLACAARARAW